MPRTHPEVFRGYAGAVEALRRAFGPSDGWLARKEFLDRLELGRVVDRAWLEERLRPLAESLAPVEALPEPFRLTLELQVYALRWLLRVERRGPAPALVVEEGGPAEDPVGGVPEPTEPYAELGERLRPGAATPVDDLLTTLRDLEAAGATLRARVDVLLNKRELNRRLADHPDPARCSRPVAFLFPKALAAMLDRRSLREIERDLFEPGQRTVLLVFGLAGGFGNRLITVCGAGLEDRLESLLGDPLPDGAVERLERTREFRRSQSLWAEAPRWLTPEVFAPDAERNVATDGTGERRRRALLASFQNLRLLLSVLFLADAAEEVDGGHRVEYSGFGRAVVPVDRAGIRKVQRGRAPERIYELYAFAYDGFSADKLEIVQQFLSLIVADTEELFTRAGEVQEAAKKTYDRALVDKVGAYFEARHKIQERLKTAVAEIAAAVIALSREVSGDLYKVVGLIAAAVVGYLVKTGIGAWAGLGAAVVIAGYLALVLAFHVPTLARTQELRLKQHGDYIRSFGDVLRRREIDDFLDDPHLDETDQLFRRKVATARWIYGTVLALAVLAALVFGNLLARAG